MGFEWECDEEGDLGSKCEPVELFMMQGRERGECKRKRERGLYIFYIFL